MRRWVLAPVVVVVLLVGAASCGGGDGVAAATTTVPRATTPVITPPVTFPTTSVPSTVDAVAAQRAELTHQRQRWADAGPTDYVFRYREDCFCPVVEAQVVVSGGEVSLVDWSPSGGRPGFDVDVPSIDELFDRVESLLGTADSVVVEYDPELGHPTAVHVDHFLDAADDEVSYVVSDLRERAPD